MTTTSAKPGTIAKPLPTAAGGFVRAWAPVFALIVSAMIVQVFVKPLLGDFFAKVALDIGVNIVLAVSLTMVNGFTGQFSMGHAAFMAVGGYSAATIVYYGSYRIFGDAHMAGGLLSSMVSDPDVSIWSKPWLTMRDGLFLISILAGGVASAACGYLVGLPSLRLKGDYLAIVSLGFGEIVRVLIQALTTDALYQPDEIAKTPWYAFPKYIGGSLGFSGLPFYSSLFWSLGLAGLTMLFAIRLKRSTFGRAFLSIREDEIAAEAMGINTTKFKIRAFVIAAFFAGMAGALFAHTSGVQLNAGELGFQKSFDIIIMVVLGGLGSISGAAIAAIILTILPEALRNPAFMVNGFWASIPFFVLGGVLFGMSKKAKAETTIPKILLIIGGVFVALAATALIAQRANVDLGRNRMIIYSVALIWMIRFRPQGLLSINEIWDTSLWRGCVVWAKAIRRGGKSS